MDLTVEEALHLYPLSKAKLVAGAKGANRVIRSVNMMDAPDVFNWVKSGEMLFTTAFAIKDTPDDFLLMLRKLNERGSAGLGIKLGRYWTEIPSIVVEEADRLHFPLIELPFEFTFSDQMNALVKAEIEKNTKQLHDALDKQKNLIRFAIQPGDSPNHFQKIGEVLSHPIVVIGARGQILYCTSDWPEAEILKGWPWSSKSEKTRTPNGLRYTLPLMQEGECCGFLLVIPLDAAIAQEDVGLFHQAAEILSFQMNRLQDEALTVSGHRWILMLERYLQGKMTPEHFIEQVKATRNTAQKAAYLCVNTIPVRQLLPESDLHNGLRKIRRDLMYHPYLTGIDSHHLFLDSGMVSIFSIPEGDISVTAHLHRIAKIYKEVLEETEDPGFRCSIGKPKFALEAVREAYQECREAIALSERLSIGHKVTMFSDLEHISLFRHIPRDAVKKYILNLLQPLLQKDDDYATEMLHTLEAYFANEGYINDAAKQLFVHRNTVLYRLEKISELLSVDLRKTSDLLQLKLALIFREILQAEE
ncbi:PucR family transcriptional regulator [Cohnella suwonensis]|uniref:PucR family transcriptional regulator n=1 Tax=Cohnella suwonensis TaxID=696072 RepID=A0ABW0LQ67_9BACL